MWKRNISFSIRDNLLIRGFELLYSENNWGNN